MSDALSSAISEATFLAEVRNQLVAVTPTVLLLKNRIYRAAYQAFLEFRRDTYICLDEEGLDTPLNSLPSLYQTWVLLVIAGALIELTSQKYKCIQHPMIVPDLGGLTVRTRTVSSLLLEFNSEDEEKRILLFSEPTFSNTTWLRNVQSISFDQRPDIVLIVEEKDIPVRIYIFDAKYKLSEQGTPLKEDIDKMHTYRDAIRSVDYSGSVSYAGIIYPGISTIYSTGIGAIRGVPGDSDCLRDDLRSLLAGEFS